MNGEFKENTNDGFGATGSKVVDRTLSLADTDLGADTDTTSQAALKDLESALHPSKAASVAGIRVLVIEDDPLLQNLLATKLERSKIEFYISTDGSDAVELAQAHTPHVVLLDLMLPGTSGFDVWSTLKAINIAAPVIVFSNKDNAETRAQAAAMGAAGFYVKALTDLEELVNIIHQVTKQ
jgi:CheY-like chemotaxis protein